MPITEKLCIVCFSDFWAYQVLCKRCNPKWGWYSSWCKSDVYTCRFWLQCSYIPKDNTCTCCHTAIQQSLVSTIHSVSGVSKTGTIHQGKKYLAFV